MRRNSVLAILFCQISIVSGQDSLYARYCIERLCAPEYAGRGYTKNGAIKAAGFIAGEMQKAGCMALGGSWYQEFSFPLNRFDKDPVLIIGGKKLVPGREFIVSADAPSGTFRTTKPGQVAAVTVKKIEDSLWRSLQLSEPAQVYLIDTLPQELEKKHAVFLTGLRKKAHVIQCVRTKLTWSAATGQHDFISFDVLRNSIDLPLDLSGLELKWKVRTKLSPTRQKNVIGMIPGTVNPDSFVLITAHYDHLGTMGRSAVFPGANDNAAGVAMILDLARYYKKNPPPFTTIFIAFAGEEPGLIGSLAYVKKPLHPLNRTRAVLNLDLVGTGETGMTVVNATVFPEEFQLLDSINKARQYLPEIRRRGKAANSDHYFFSEMGIPAFFWYQSGPRTSYHDIDDIPSTLSLAGYRGTFLLATDWLKAISR